MKKGDRYYSRPGRGMGFNNLTIRDQEALLRRQFARDRKALRLLSDELRNQAIHGFRIGLTVRLEGSDVHHDVPRLGELILLCVLSKKARESLPGDLAEEFAEIVLKHGLRKARFWYWCQVVRSIGPLVRLGLVSSRIALRLTPVIEFSTEQRATGERQKHHAMTDDEISEAGRKARFERWEKLGLDAIRQDLATGGHRLVGGPPQVRELAREWVKMKEAEQEVDARAVLRALGVAPAPSVEDILSGRDTALDELVRSAAPPSASIPASGQEAPAPPAPAVSQEKRAELVTLRPNLYGIGIDLKELARRLRSWLHRRRGKPS
jgi:hypothetical protein